MKIKRIDMNCSTCGCQLNTWDAKLSKTLTYQNSVCENCIADEYDMNVERLRAYFEEVFGMRPCAGL